MMFYQTTGLNMRLQALAGFFKALMRPLMSWSKQRQEKQQAVADAALQAALERDKWALLDCIQREGSLGLKTEQIAKQTGLSFSRILILVAALKAAGQIHCVNGRWRQGLHHAQAAPGNVARRDRRGTFSAASAHGRKP